MPKYTYRKRFDHDVEIDETASNFRAEYNQLAGMEIALSKRSEDDGLYLYLIAEGDIPDPAQLGAAIGYDLVGVE